MSVSRRSLLTGAVATGSVASVAACSRGTATTSATRAVARTSTPPTPVSYGTVLDFELGKPLGDGSTSEHRPQPGHRQMTRLAPGATPPQLVVVSWDGAADLASGLLTRFRDVAKRTGAHMTLFLSGIYFVPEGKRNTYHPPAGHAPGSSAIPFLNEQSVHRTIKGIGEAWVEGHEIGTHFNGHWCGRGGVDSWSTTDWRTELAEAKRMVKSWKTITGFTDLPALPFDYDVELVGSRTPCLEGRTNLLPVAKENRWRYDTSGTSTQRWQRRLPNGLWDTSMPSLPFRGREVLGMDYNYMYQQSHASTNGDKSKRPAWRAEVIDTMTRGLERAKDGNRAPLVVGNHFEQWNGGIYMDAVEAFMERCAGDPDVQLVSMRELCDFLDAQDPRVLAALQKLEVGQKPPGGWAEYLGAATAKP